ncbi:MAG: putative ABC transporter ATP-binding protein YxlF [Chloroflexi bacterium ADurb.Bin360]|nr:MAG: putative ABC transporter ATP-binding protein YxlF [Chloroflexi bacterium ADurb.Bin360]
MNETVVIRTNGLSKTYEGVEALKPLDLTVTANSIFGFLGPNGAGKTTTMKLLLGLIRPTSGSATIFGMDSVRQSPDIRARIGYLPQEPRFYEHHTVRETLDFTARFFFKGPEQAIRQRIEEMLDLVGLEDKADRKVKTLSGGEQQRLGIAQAQVNYPDLLILDEPAASLDPLGRRDVLEVLSRLRKHTTVFYSTHILDDVQKVSDTVAILNHGVLAAYGPIETLLAGSSGVVYTVTLKGSTEPARARIAALPWVRDLQASEREGQSTWTVAVSDELTAEQQLLRTILVDTGLIVTSFGRKRYELEEVFTNIVEGGAHGGKQ